MFIFCYAGSALPLGLLSSRDKQGFLSRYGVQASLWCRARCGIQALGCMGFSSCRTGFSSRGSRAPEHGLKSCGAQALGSSQIRG